MLQSEARLRASKANSRRAKARRDEAYALGAAEFAELVALAARWIRRLARGKVRFSVQYHADQDLEELRRFWSELVGVRPEEIALQRKSNSNGLQGRKWRSRYGVLSVSAADTMLRARLQAWIDLTVASWA